MICPNCRHARQEHESSVMAGVCPACGIAYNKWLARRQGEAAESSRPPVDTAPSPDMAEIPPWRERARHYLLHMPSDRHESAFWAHVVFYLVFLVWGWRFILNGIDYTFIGTSFLHLVNLPFHEYGHIAFSPFGTFMTFLGGSLFQIMTPLMPGLYFLMWRRDNFPASLMLWWCGQNFIDVSVYIKDAPVRALPLITGDANTHDWWNLLLMTSSLDSAGTYAAVCFGIGALVIIASNVWGALLLRVEFEGRTVLPEVDEEAG